MVVIQRRYTISLLHIALQEGFANDSVVVRVNGAEAYRKAGVKTRMQIGLADSVDVDVPAHGSDIDAQSTMAKVEVEIPKRRLKTTLAVNLAETTHIGISINAGKIVARLSREPFGYV